MSIRKRRVYDKEFKIDAVRLVTEEGQKTSEVECNLGIGTGFIYRWIRELRDDPGNAFSGKGHLKPDDEEFRKLKRENERLRRERDILKKAIT